MGLQDRTEIDVVCHIQSLSDADFLRYQAASMKVVLDQFPAERGIYDGDGHSLGVMSGLAFDALHDRLVEIADKLDS